MKKYSATKEQYKIILSSGNDCEIYPLLRSIDRNDANMYLVSPLHGRSYVVGKKEDRYVVSKGNGLSYSNYQFLNTKELGTDSWGLLLAQDAKRDFIVGDEVRALGIKANHMEYVLELQKYVLFQDGTQLKPILLQYNVECPYRISDAPFMTRREIEQWVSKWKSVCKKSYEHYYLMAAEVLIGNLHVLHSNGILHNAISVQNYTWALELLDFELAHSPNYPKTSEDAKRHIPILFDREIIHTYEIIVYIAGCLQEQIDFGRVDKMFENNGFDIKKYLIM